MPADLTGFISGDFATVAKKASQADKDRCQQGWETQATKTVEKPTGPDGTPTTSDDASFPCWAIALIAVGVVLAIAGLVAVIVACRQ